MMPQQVDVTGTGFVVLDRVYADGLRPVESLGGSCGNILLSLAMLSRQVAPVLSLGDDEVGRGMIAEFESAGACTHYIRRRLSVSSPILAQFLNTQSGQHSFSFICPDTDEELPAYKSIELDEVRYAEEALRGCRVFYADRLSEAIVEAMECASAAGALVYFEPSTLYEKSLFDRALCATTILKYSADRLGGMISRSSVGSGTISIVTHGAIGLEVRQDEERQFLPAVSAPIVRDTCGSGDMVSVGIIDELVSQSRGESRPSLQRILSGVRAGQRLAAANCAFAGARGLFQRHGSALARSVLDDIARPDWFAQLELFSEN